VLDRVTQAVGKGRLRVWTFGSQLGTIFVRDGAENVVAVGMDRNPERTMERLMTVLGEFSEPEPEAQPIPFDRSLRKIT
jgi:hypothetical protein